MDLFEGSDAPIDLGLSGVALESIIRVLLIMLINMAETASQSLQITKARTNPDCLEIRVSDTGSGVDKKCHSIFEPLFD